MPNKVLKNMLALKKTHEMLKSRAFYNINSILGNRWAEFFFLIGGAQAGKSYSVTDFFLKQFFKHGTVFYWIRLTEKQARQLLQNNAEKLIDPDLIRKYNLDLTTSGSNVYQVTKRSKPDKDGKTKILKKKLMARVLALSTYYGDKGNGYFDKDYTGWYNVAVDEFQPEKGERRTFDIVYAFVRQMENLMRNTKNHVRIFLMCNLLEEASDILCCFNFIPEQFGRYKLKKKRAVIDYIEPTEAYKQMRKGSIADILMPDASEYSNKQKVDYTLITKKRLQSPTSIIKFSKNTDGWFTIWDSNVVTKYNNEKKASVAMLPYLDEVFNAKMRDAVILAFDNRQYYYRNLITFKEFQKNINLIKPRGN